MHVLVGEYKPHSLSRNEAKTACAEHPCLLGSAKPCQTAVHWTPFSTSVFKALMSYNHKDLQKVLFYSGLRQKLHSKPYALLFFAASCDNNDWVSVTRLSAIHFRASPSGRWVVTHSLADFEFHEKRPAVERNQHPSWYLMSEHLSTLTQMSGSSLIAISAYHKWATWSYHLRHRFTKVTTGSYPFQIWE